MKNKSLNYSILIMISLLMLTGCGIFSLHPLYKPTDLIEKSELVGQWRCAGDHGLQITIDAADDRKYRFQMVDNTDTAVFEMALISLKDQFFIDLYPLEDCNIPSDDNCQMVELMVKNYIPIHTFMKLDLEQDAIVLTEFDNERLIDLFASNRIRLAHEMINEDEYVVITASTDNLQKFVARYANDRDAFEEPVIYEKL